MYQQDFTRLNSTTSQENVESRAPEPTVHHNLPQRYYLDATISLLQDISVDTQVQSDRVQMTSPAHKHGNLNMLLNSVYCPLPGSLSYVPEDSMETTEPEYLWSGCQRKCQDRNQDQDGFSIFPDDLITPPPTGCSPYGFRSNSPQLIVDMNMSFGTYSVNMESPYSTDSFQSQIGECDIPSYQFSSEKKQFENHLAYPIEHLFDENVTFLSTGFYQPVHNYASGFPSVNGSIMTNSATNSPESVSNSLHCNGTSLGDQSSSDRCEWTDTLSSPQGQSSSPYENHSYFSPTESTHRQARSEKPIVPAGSTKPSQRSEQKPHPCTVCEKSFARKHDLGRHMRIHTGDKPYVCLCCKKAFARTDALSRHFSREETCGNSAVVQASLRHVVGRRQHRKQ